MRYKITIFALLLNFTLSYADRIDDKNSVQSSTGIGDKYYVGADNACDFSTIQLAINAANNSQNSPEVRVAYNKNYNEILFISNSNIFIDGSYASCSDARNNIHGGNRAKIDGFPGSEIAIIQVTTGLFVHIKGMQLQNNNGGGIYAAGTSVITLEDMLLFQLGTHALEVSGDGQIEVRIKNSLFLLNSGSGGSAIRCEGSNHTINVTENSGFANNTISGAIFLNNGCDFLMSGGGFQNNSSELSGGAIYAEDSIVTLINVTFNSNIAGMNGGAIMASGGTQINAEATRFINNQSANYGGAISLFDFTSLTLNGTAESCLQTNKCNLFDNNTAKNGGALSLLSNFLANISSTYFENNRADFGTAIYSIGTSSAKIEGSVFNHNGNHAADGFGDRSVIFAASTTFITLTYSTFADNKVLFSTFKQEGDSELNVYSSIIYDPDSGNVFESTGSSTTLNAHCLIVHETSSFNTTNAMVTAADPIFVDAANGDYHINAALSPAVDYCTDNLAMAQNQDIDFEDRGFDDSAVINNFTNAIYDIGADETQGNDIIFDNGFE